MSAKDEINFNIKTHNKRFKKYMANHGEIYNPVEQQRLFRELKSASELITGNPNEKTALDLGCGAGNLTNHLLNLGFCVTAADVSEKFLSLIKKNFGTPNKIKTLKLNGEDLSNIPDNTFDFAATYSVMHHIPDYLRIAAEMARVVKSGGIIYIDHEVNEEFWAESKMLTEFSRQAFPPESPGFFAGHKRYFMPSKYVSKIKRILKIEEKYQDPKTQRRQEEGDIHVWKDDHIEWDKIEAALIKNGCKIIIIKDYLLFRRGYIPEVYEKYKDKCSDMKMIVALKI